MCIRDSTYYAYLRYLVKIKHHISYFYNLLFEVRTSPAASSTVWNIKFMKYRENTLYKYVQNVCLWHEHKHAGVLAIGQLHRQSATVPSCSTHAVDTVAAHRCHTHDTEWQTKNSIIHISGAMKSGVGRCNSVTCAMSSHTVLLKNKVTSCLRDIQNKIKQLNRGHSFLFPDM